MTFDTRTADLARLNSLTKYPAIPTYHALDTRNGGLLEEPVPFEGTVLGTEKIDGTNARLICLPDGCFLLGSREELLYARGDLIGNPALGIVEALKDLAERIVPYIRYIHPMEVSVFYLEVFGGRVTAASRQYSGTQRVSSRLFDLMRLQDYGPLLAREPPEISLWRENGGQPFVSEDELLAVSEAIRVPLTPRLFSVDAGELPRTVAEMAAFLAERLPSSRSTLDDGAGGRAEGVVLRTPARSVIAKARFEDYERTLKRRARR